MAVLAVGLAGSAIGGIFGAQSLGWAIGVYIGQQLFGPQPPDMEGPRLTDLNVTSSAYGSIIPVCYGTVRVAGNIIWTIGLREQKHTEDVGGKGGGGGSYTTYTYSASFALSLAEGPAKDILRIWADGKLIYDVNTPQTKDVDDDVGVISLVVRDSSQNLKFRFYKGTETQTPDGLIMSDKGTDIPAHRGLCYIVFEDLALKDFGNRIPNITCEIAFETPLYSDPSEYDMQSLLSYLGPTTSVVNAGAGVKYTRPQRRVYNYPYFESYGPEDFVYYVRPYAVETSPLVYTPYLAMVKINVASGAVVHATTHEFPTYADSSPNLVPYAGYYEERLHMLMYRDFTTFDPSYTEYYYSHIQFDAETLARISVPFIEQDNEVIAYIIRVEDPPLSGTYVPYIDGSTNVRVTDRGYAVFYLGRDVSTTDYYVYYVELWSIEGHRTGTIYFDYYGTRDDHYGTPLPGADYEEFPEYRGDGTPRAAITRLGELFLACTVVTTDVGATNEYSLVFYLMDPLSGKRFISAKISVDSIINDNTGTLQAIALRYLEYDNSILVMLDGNALATATHHVIKLNMDEEFQYEFGASGTIAWYDTTDTPIDWIFPDDAAAITETYTPISRSQFIYFPGTTGDDVRIFDLDTGVDATASWTDPRGAITYPAFQKQYHRIDPYSGYIWQWIIWSTSSPYAGSSGYHRIGFLTDAIPTAGSLPAVVQDICSRVDLDPVTDVDVTDLAGIEIYGYKLSQQSPARAALEQLSTAYQFDLVESDYQLTAKLRGQTPVAALTQDDFAIMDQNTATIIKETRTQEVELPVRVEINYIDLDNDYQPNVQRASRSQQPIPTMESINSVSLDLPIVAKADQMKQLAEKILYSTWLNRTSYEGSTAWRWAKLDPTDVISITMNDGTVFKARVMQADFAGDLTVQLAMISEDETLYSSSVVADGGQGVPAQDVPVLAKSTLIMLDVPLLRDIDSLSRERHRMYFSVSATRDGWPGAGVLSSSNDLDYGVMEQALAESPWGITTNALDDTDTPFMTDYDSTLTLYMQREGDTLASVTRDQMLTDGANAAAVIKANGEVEIIQYQNVTDNGDGTYTLDTFFRGRRGTDTFVNGHAANAKVVFLDHAVTLTAELSLAQRDVTRYYRAVTYGMLLDSADTAEYAHSGRDLMPYAPVNEAAAISGSDVDITWVRRTRINGFLRDGTDEVPLEEDTEEYELEIYDGPGGTLLRTYTGITSPTYTYPSADITTDFGSIPSTLTIKVYQISAQVGRGFSREVTIPVT